MADHDDTLDTGVAVLDHLTGPSRGRRTWVAADAVDLSMTPSRLIHCRETRGGVAPDGLVARLRRSGRSYELIAASEQTVWINGQPVREQVLKSGDMIELGDHGPLSRFRLFHEEGALGHSIGEIFSDAGAYLRSSRQPYASRLARAAAAVLRRLVRETTLLFRVVVVCVILVLGYFLYQQVQTSSRLEQQIASGAERLDSVASAFARAQRDALTPDDLRALGSELGERMRANAERLALLEERSTAFARVVAAATPSVGFVQNAFGFREKNSGQFLRYRVDGSGTILKDRDGDPAVTLGGDGPVAEIATTGTGFALAGARVLLTNRHVAMPWEDNADVELMAIQGMEAVQTRIIVYFPGNPAPIEINLLAVSDEADLAVFAPADGSWPDGGLALADDVPAIGSEVAVMGFPTGFSAMLARSDPALIDEIVENESMDFWSVAQYLAERDWIAPLVSRGIVAQVSGIAVIYDADTTHGGSGGPVLDLEGRVVAVNAAGLTGYGGSNIGVPVSEVRRLLANAGFEL